MWDVPLGMNVKDNPLVKTPYAQGEAHHNNPIPGSENLLTEDFMNILTEDFVQLSTD